jgi:hypothetical protein
VNYRLTSQSIELRERARPTARKLISSAINSHSRPIPVSTLTSPGWKKAQLRDLVALGNAAVRQVVVGDRTRLYAGDRLSRRCPRATTVGDAAGDRGRNHLREKLKSSS